MEEWQTYGILFLALVATIANSHYHYFQPLDLSFVGPGTINVAGQALAPLYPLWESQELIIKEIGRVE